MNCSDIPSSDNGADINFKTIPFIGDTHETISADTIVALHESTEFTSEVDDVCADVSLADGQAEGGIGVVLDTTHCPEGLASGCIGDAGCRYCMRFPTNTSEYLEYCAIVNSSSVAYDLSGTDSTPSDEGSSTSLSGGVPRAISAEERGPSSEDLDPHKSTAVNWSIGGVACVGAIAAVGLAAFGIKQTIGSLAGGDTKSPCKEKVSPDDENRASVLVTSNVGEPGVIRDV
ncbi:hypothetical protein PRIC1_009274 [Phytophthora ramorum]|nr:hypothetical protein KRP22_5351 [Phytophthora ramorum]